MTLREFEEACLRCPRFRAVVRVYRWQDVRRNPRGSPAPDNPRTATELPAVTAAFDQFFQTVKTRETPAGVAMFSLEKDSEAAARARGEAETEAVRRQYEGTPQWMKGPNGEPTNLNERQWLQVRTPSFIRWFGDWLATNLLSRIKATDPVSVKVLPEHSGEWKTVKGAALGSYAGRDKVTNRETGNEVLILESGLDDALQHGMGTEKVALLGRVDDLLERAVFVVRDTENMRRGVKAIETYAARATIDGRAVVVRLVVREVSDGRRFYDHELTDLENARLGVHSEGRAVAFAAQPGPRLSPSLGERVLREALSVNPSNVSKVVDANGEPLVVYHGTAADIEAFDLDHPGRHDTGWLGKGVYLTTSPEIARAYAMMKHGNAGENILPLFANLRNPLEATQRDKDRMASVSRREGRAAGLAASAEWTADLKQRGHDGVVLDYRPEEVGEAHASKELVVFDPAGVKSATANVGTYNPGTQYIRLSIDPSASGWSSAEGGLVDRARLARSEIEETMNRALAGLGVELSFVPEIDAGTLPAGERAEAFAAHGKSEKTAWRVAGMTRVDPTTSRLLVTLALDAENRHAWHEFFHAAKKSGLFDRRDSALLDATHPGRGGTLRRLRVAPLRGEMLRS